MERSLPPSARRLGLARRAGLVLTSPAVTSAFALAAGLAAAAAALAATAAALTTVAREGWRHAAGADAAPRALAVDAGDVAGRTITLAAPVVVAGAAVALVVTAVLARGLVVPRRRVRGAPGGTDDTDDTGARATDALVGLVRALAIGGVAAAFVVTRLPAFSRLAGLPATAITSALRSHALAALAHVAVAAIAASSLELAVRGGRRRAALRMTVREARDELRETGGDSASRRHRGAGRGDPRARLAGAIVLVVDDAVAVALGWRPGAEPDVLARGRGVDARALQSAARARGVPIAFTPALAASLAASGVIPAAERPAVAELVATLGLVPR